MDEDLAFALQKFQEEEQERIKEYRASEEENLKQILQKKKDEVQLKIKKGSAFIDEIQQQYAKLNKEHTNRKGRLLEEISKLLTKKVRG